MGIQSLRTSGINNLVRSRSMLIGNEAFDPSSFDLIQTYILSSNQSSVTFSNLDAYSSTYKHLQLRATTRATTSADNIQLSFLRINGDTGSNYSRHFLQGNGATVASGGDASQTSMFFSTTPQNTTPAGLFSAEVIDFLDAYSTTKNKTIRIFHGVLNTGSSGPRIMLNSSARLNTESITSITCLTGSNDFAIGSRFSLYGIKG